MESQFSRVGEVHFHLLSRTNAVKDVIRRAQVNQSRHIHLLNAYSVTLAHADKDFATSIALPAINYADGKPISIVSLFRRDKPAIDHIRGPDFFRSILDEGREHGIRHYFLGSTDLTLEKLVANVTADYPGVQIVGTDSPPFRPATQAEFLERDRNLRDSRAHIVWVGLGTPKQDLEVARIAASTKVTAIAVGAGFDFLAGTVPEAPKALRAMGLEWIFRLATEPRRLWRRYLVGNPQFIRIAARSLYGSQRT